jgi:glutamate--cysteine ligase
MDSRQVALSALTAERLRGIRRGLEKESLRVAPDATLATTPHPSAMGSALTHPHITTDFCESQVEFVTGAHARPEDCLSELADVHRFSLQAMGNECLWASSMPCCLPEDDAIPLGQYGSSNVGRAKTVYRSGLGYRYGRRMQTISGIHFNWSMPDTSSEAYFGLIRNFRRHAFLLLYLFGASPAVCSTFVAGRVHQLRPLGEASMYLPHATSLRMGRLGYQSEAQASLAVSYNSLEGYGRSLEVAMTQPYGAYEDIGVRGPDGSYRQLATSLLQIENEFYGTIRPKRVTFPGERPLHALRERGVEYVEVRLMDLDPFEPVGIRSGTMRFLDVFLLHSLSTVSPSDTPAEIAAMARNQQIVAERGREQGLQLERAGETVSLFDWGSELLAQMKPFARALDVAYGNTLYTASLEDAAQGLHAPDTLPSARVLRAIEGDHRGSFVAFAMERSQRARSELLAQPLSPERIAQFEHESAKSWDVQREVEAADSMPFDIYLKEFLAPRRLSPITPASL